MKGTILFCAIILISACNHSGKSTIIEKKMDLKAMNDSIIQLILSFQQNHDSTTLKNALSLNEKVIAIDSANNSQYYNLNTRIQILGLLNNKKEAFFLKEKTLSKDKSNIDRLIYYGQKNKLIGLGDSSEIYYNAALMQCDKLLKDSLNTSLIIKKAEIYIYQQREADALRVIEQALVKDPENIILIVFKDDFDEYCKRVNNLFDDIKL